MPVVLRIAEATFAASIAAHFDLKTTFSVAALAAPTFAGLSYFGGSRGRIAFGGEEFAIGETTVEDGFQDTIPRTALPLAVWRGGDLSLMHGVGELRQGDRVLMIVPLAPFRDGTERIPAASERAPARN